MSVFTYEGTENEMRWDASNTPFMEVWYVTLTHAASGLAVWLRYTLTAPKPKVGGPYCELWGFLFDPEEGAIFAGKERYPIDQLAGRNGRDDGALVRIGTAWLSESHLEGAVERAGSRLSWSLDLEPSDRCFRHIPTRLSSLVERRVSTVCSPNLSVPFTGTVTLDDRTIEFDGDLGGQTHRWGVAHSGTWAWVHSSHFEDEGHGVFEGVAAKASLGPLPAPTLTFLYLQLDGEDIVLNEFRDAFRARSSYEMPTWAFTADNGTWKVVGAARANPARMVQVRYMDPDGSERYCCNSEVSDLGLEVYRREGPSWSHYRSLTALRTAHLEFGRKEPFPGIPVAF